MHFPMKKRQKTKVYKLVKIGKLVYHEHLNKIKYLGIQFLKKKKKSVYFTLKSRLPSKSLKKIQNVFEMDLGTSLEEEI